MHPLCHPSPGKAIPCTSTKPHRWSVNSMGQRPTPPLLGFEAANFLLPVQKPVLQTAHLRIARHVRALGKPRDAVRRVVDANDHVGTLGWRSKW